ncbi:GTP-binding protein [Bifidobacterium dolichotidis]|uniref:GTP-binding protein n=1 Tax=Bifidobacterium dolichotidis TaxID=2306976 RepID=A0A430FS07_9BIFI|nr:TetM/TetW/TetO/TetS family tetracycline resistance ribosomal protection protein [Bifidobacterium dolichotidis]RSX55627.1 GTP-binding protein [Bifidobacterium dolichotidis]
MKRVVAGIVAHVDAGKTTLSESLLYTTGAVRTLGRVDHGDAFLDTDAIERERGITIFTEPAVLHITPTDAATEIKKQQQTQEPLQVTLLDTPGHVDFSAETERTLAALDYAVLVISGTDGVQGHTETLWRLLERYAVPTIVFVNKMDMPGADEQTVLEALQHQLSSSCARATTLLHDMRGGIGEAADADVNGGTDRAADQNEPLGTPSAELEEVAMLSEQAMNEYLETGAIQTDTIRTMVADRSLFPVFFGSALKLEGIQEFLNGFAELVTEPEYPDEFGARVVRISHDASGNRLTWLKVTGGVLRAKTELEGTDLHGQAWQDKVDQVRAYSGAKYTTVQEVAAGTVAAVTGLTQTFPGEGLGFESNAPAPVLQPVMTYTLLPGDEDIHKCLTALNTLGDEDPLLHVVWDTRLEQIHVQLMGRVQLEVIEELLRSRFGLEVSFGPGSVLYKETISEPQEGVGHFEPLRHYAEAHILLEPLPEGSGIEVASALNEDELDRNWQRLILTHCVEREHLGVLTGSPLTDVKMTLVAARAHLKHTEGGDFRQATYRAISQALMELKERSACVLLEPWLRFSIEVPLENVGRAMADVQRMGGSFDSSDDSDSASAGAGAGNSDMALVRGVAPAVGLQDYALTVSQYTHGRGRLTLVFDGYRPAHNAEEILEQSTYDAESDLEHTPDSVFCAHGAGYPVKWYQVPEFMHLPYATDAHQ